MEKGLIFVAMEMSSGDFRGTELTLKGWWKGVRDDIPSTMSSKDAGAEAGLNTGHVQENLEWVSTGFRSIIKSCNVISIGGETLQLCDR